MNIRLISHTPCTDLARWGLFRIGPVRLDEGKDAQVVLIDFDVGSVVCWIASSHVKLEVQWVCGSGMSE